MQSSSSSDQQQRKRGCRKEGDACDGAAGDAEFEVV